MSHAARLRRLLPRALVAATTLIGAFPPRAAAQDDEIFGNGFEQYTLTITNYLSWCSVAVDGNPPSTNGMIILDFPSGAVVPLHGEPASVEFVWGYWTGTDGDVVNNDPNQDTTVTMNADRNVLACCPFSGGGGTCP